MHLAHKVARLFLTVIGYHLPAREAEQEMD